MNVKIINLKDEPSHIAQLAEWHHNEWSYLNPNGSIEKRAERMKIYLEPDFIPSTFIAKDDQKLMGSAAIVKHDLDTHKELSPWLAAVYVASDYRKQGIGRLLITHIMQKAKKQGVKKMYLFTSSEDKFYAKLGWTIHSEENYSDEPIIIMEVNL